MTAGRCLSFRRGVLWIALAPGFASAQWLPLLDNEKGRVFVSVERQTIAPGQVRVRGMQEPSTPVQAPKGWVRSVQSVEDFDCVGRRTRLLQLDFREGLGGTGASLQSSEHTGDWRPVSGPYAEALWRHACQPGAAR